MAEWSPNNRACTSTWMALRVLGQSKRAFSVTGALTMKQLAFFNTASSTEMRAVQARTLAVAMDGVFRQVDGAGLEAGTTASAAVKDIAEVLVNADSTVADLAERNDDNYDFFGEQ